MRPAALISRAPACSSVDKPLRTAQNCAKASEAAKQRLTWQPAAADGCLAAYSALPAPAPASSKPTCPAKSAPAAAHLPAGDGDDALLSLLDAGRLLGRLLDSLAQTLLGGLEVPAHLQSLLSRLFPAATSVSTTLPSADGQGLAVTTLLQSPTLPTAPQPHYHQHSEPLGRGVCSFRLWEAPSDASQRLMRAFAEELSTRLALRAEEQVSDAHGLTAQHSVQSMDSVTLAPITPRATLASPTPPTSPPRASSGEWDASPDSPSADSMPADCFWMSV